MLTAVSFSVVLDSVFSVSTVGVAVIVTRSSTPDTFIDSGRFMAWPTVRSAFSTTRVAKPDFETVSVYLPGGNCKAINRPSSSVVEVLTKFVSTFFTSTLAPGRAAPLASSTVPWIVPAVICVCASTPTANTRITNRQIPSPLTRTAKERSKALSMVFSCRLLAI